MRARLVLALVVGACGQTPSQLDHAFDKKPEAADPWATSFARPTGADDDKGGGFDLQGMLAKIKDSVEKPGFYEPPETSADFKADKPHWGVMKLSGDIVEREAFSLTGGRGTELRQLIDRLRELSRDDQLQGVVLRVGSVTISLPDAIELRAAMRELRRSKKLYCHTEGVANAGYLVLAACDKIGLAPLGEIAITGPAAMPIHIKGLLDKLGIEADFIHVGAYKGAAEPLTRDAPSKEMEETLGAILDRRYDTMVDAIAKDRALDAAKVKTLIDTGLFAADAAKAEHLVDEVASFEAFRDGVQAPWTKLESEPESGGHRDTLGAYLRLARFIGAMPPERPLSDHVAIVYAIGNIVDGDGQGLLGARQEIASHTLVPALHALAMDPAVKAVVLRIDSGGGSAQASELIWAAVAELVAKKPVIVSMSDVAASGGYYIASGATKIFALDDTLTGSIGVVGGRIAPAAALAKLGVTTFPMGRGKHATMMASFQPWKPDEKHVIQTTMEDVYKTFVGRVASGRGKAPDQIELLARGRVWTGAKAKELGLVDEIGGLDAALAEAEKLGKVDATSDLEVYPPAPTLRDLIHGWGGVHAPFGLAITRDLGLRELDPRLADAAERLVGLVLSFRTTHIQTLAILPELP